MEMRIITDQRAQIEYSVPLPLDSTPKPHLHCNEALACTLAAAAFRMVEVGSLMVESYRIEEFSESSGDKRQATNAPDPRDCLQLRGSKPESLGLGCDACLSITSNGRDHAYL